MNYLKHLDSTDWNVFCGVIADFNDNTEISNIVKFHNEEYIHINKMTSTVFNIYNKNFFKKMVNWDQNERDVDINTIDNEGNTPLLNALKNKNENLENKIKEISETDAQSLMLKNNPIGEDYTSQE